MRLVLSFSFLLFGLLTPVSSLPDVFFRFGWVALAAAPVIGIFLPLWSSYRAAHMNETPRELWEKPSWFTDPLNAQGPHHFLHIAGILLYAAGIGVALRHWSEFDDVHSDEMLSRGIVVALLIVSATNVKLGIVASQGIYASRYASERTSTRLSDRTDRIAALLWLGVALLVPILILVAALLFAF
jgi:hypothetical protein